MSLVQNSVAKHSLRSKDCGLDRWPLFAKSDRNFGIGHLPVVVQHQQDSIVSRQTAQFLPHLVLLLSAQHTRKRRNGQTVRQRIEFYFIIHMPPPLGLYLAQPVYTMATRH